VNHKDTENTKKKKLQTTHLRKFLRICFKVVAGLFGIAMCMLGFFAYWAWGGYINVKSYLDAEYIPTAEYLLGNPIETPYPDSFPYDFRVWTNVQLTSSERLCFDVVSMDNQDFLNLDWAEVYVNEQIISRYHWRWSDFVWTTMPAHSIVCMPTHLESGIHIIEFRAKESAWSVPYYIHKWAIEVD
jgi:hypothetical protein